MFYSHTFLAKKGPLGTVWCAAHVQHRLKKSHYTATHIPSTVERIMFPEVPIALRMSGHLLLGVVRIYSKKIDYLYQDYNVLLFGISKAFDASSDVNLPKDATHAKSDDVTLPSPSKFALDELDLDLDEYTPERLRDNHRRSLEDITIPDQIPVGRDLFIAINISEDVPRDSTHLENAPGSGPVSMEEEYENAPESRPDLMEEDYPTSTPMDATAGSGPSYQIGVNERPHEDCIPDNNPSIFHHTEDDVLEPDTVLVEVMRANHTDTQIVEQMLVSGGKSVSQQENHERQPAPSEPSPNNVPKYERMRDADHSEVMVDATMLSLVSEGKSFSQQENLDGGLGPETIIEEPAVEEMLVSERKSIHQQENQEPQSAPSEQGHDINGSPIAYEIQPSPPVEQRRPRRLKRLFDEKTVLTNKFMKRALDDSRDLMRRRKDWCSSLGLWRLNNKQKQEKVFLDPLTTGLCDDLSNMFNKDYISAKDHLVLRDESHPDPNFEQPLSPVAHPASSSAQPLSPTVQNPSAASPAPSAAAQPPFAAAQSPSAAAQLPFASAQLLSAAAQSFSATAQSPSASAQSPSAAAQLPSATGQPLSPVAEPSSPVNDLDMETERLRNVEGSAETNNIMSGILNSSNSFAFSPAGTSGGSRVSEIETPLTSSEERIGFNHNRLSDIPELDNNRELSFLEEEDHTPAGLSGSPEVDYSLRKHKETPEVDSLSVRARAVAQYLKNKSSATPISGEDHGDLSLNTILEGKKRKICARMFFETLVLKNSGLIDVKQDETFSDIKLKVTPKLSKEQFSN